MAQKCVRQGCGKMFSDHDGCRYHSGPPIFHEGQKGWKCCKPRVLTFEEFMSIPPCTEGQHSTTDFPPQIEKQQPSQPTPSSELAEKIDRLAAAATPSRAPIPSPRSAAGTPPPPAESEDDDPNIEIANGKACRRRGCDATYKAGGDREEESCVHHPGAPIFHEGSKGYTCCKRRVLEFDQFMKLEGCTTKDRHLFVGSGKRDKRNGTSNGVNGEEMLSTVRTDFYQTPATVIASFFLKKIVKDSAKVDFKPESVQLDLVTSDSPPKRYAAEVPLFASIDPAKSTYKILGTKLEVSLAKGDDASWQTLRSDDPSTGEMIQTGRAGRFH